MGWAVETEIGFDLNLFAARTVGGFFKEASATADGGVAKLEESVRSLEEERKKIEAFKRELPLCMLLLTDVIEMLKKELDRFQGERFAHSFKEFIPIGRKCEEEGGVKLEADCKDKAHWMSSAQLWSANSGDDKGDDGGDGNTITDEKSGVPDRTEEGEHEVHLETRSQGIGCGFSPFKAGVSPPKEAAKPTSMLPDLPIRSPAVDPAAFPISIMPGDHHSDSGAAAKRVGRAPPPATGGPHLTLQLQQQQPPRKARRCWSPELHRRFVLALQQLGGAQVATPKQIRELMKVDGLTNDEVKSHLQKYRLHTKKTPNGSSVTNRPVMTLGGLWMPPENYTSSSPQSPLQLVVSNLAISATAGSSCEEDDGKSESFNWRS
ncbi:transcription factor NIGTH1-like [Curcuma longa]|uniref:transcription factor NIGTH1-like n=1 Tax=Curcuma longa TaxID=136217 RepID=UPI003D9F3AF9